MDWHNCKMCAESRCWWLMNFHICQRSCTVNFQHVRMWNLEWSILNDDNISWWSMIILWLYNYDYWLKKMFLFRLSFFFFFFHLSNVKIVDFSIWKKVFPSHIGTKMKVQESSKLIKKDNCFGIKAPQPNTLKVWFFFLLLI